jgi:hypothetical protein
MTRDDLNGWWKVARDHVAILAAAERRFSVAVDERLSDDAGLAACDELLAATSEVLVWLDTHPCPDGQANADLHSYIEGYKEVAVVMRSAVGAMTEEEQTATLARVHAIHEQIKQNGRSLSTRIDELLA